MRLLSRMHALLAGVAVITSAVYAAGGNGELAVLHLWLFSVFTALSVLFAGRS